MAPINTIRREFGSYSVLKHNEFGKERVAVLKPITDDIADYIRGELPETDGEPVLYIGDSGGKHYYRSHDLSELDDWVIEAAEEHGLTIIDNVDGGWETWDGRPEWSESYIDFNDAEIATLETTA